MVSVVIAAHNEAAVIGGCLEALRASGSNLEIIVAANGCTDDTADVARRRGARVVEIAEAGKALALNAGDQAATSFPRIYLDADIQVPRNAVAGLMSALTQPGILAAGPMRRIDSSRSSLAVRAYFAINSRLPAFEEGLFGRGMIAVSQEGRLRFDRFPLMVADDLFLDSMFAAEEKTNTREVEVTVEAPRRTRDLVRRLVRVRQGNAEMRSTSGSEGFSSSVRQSDSLAWLRVVVPRRLYLLPAAVVYVAVTVTASARARSRVGKSQDWGRDESTRQVSQTRRARE